MKHPLIPTIMILLLFVTAQIAGLFIIKEYIDIHQSSETGETVTKDEVYDRVGVEPPEIEKDDWWIYVLTIMVSILIGTGIVLLIIKFKKKMLWKAWYFLAIFFSLAIALNPFVFKLLQRFGIENYFVPVLYGIVIALSLMKLFKPNMYVHNITEVLIYGGISALLVVYIVDIYSASLLLILISVYDLYAVWKSKHMVKMAQFQSVSNVFAGFSIPYLPEKGKKKPKPLPKIKLKKSVKKQPKKKIKVDVVKYAKTAILGGGDVAFPLVFSGAVMKSTGIFPIIVTLTTSVALLLLLLRGEKGKFYPAMPFISAGCFLGLGLTYLFLLI